MPSSPYINEASLAAHDIRRRMKRPFASISDADGETTLYLCTKHGPLPPSAFYASDLRTRRRCCRECVQRRVSKSRGGGAAPCAVRRSLAAFKARARRHNAHEAVNWDLNDVQQLLERDSIEDYTSLRITPTSGLPWLPSNCRIVKV